MSFHDSNARKKGEIGRYLHLVGGSNPTLPKKISWGNLLKLQPAFGGMLAGSLVCLDIEMKYTKSFP